MILGRIQMLVMVACCFACRSNPEVSGDVSSLPTDEQVGDTNQVAQPESTDEVVETTCGDPSVVSIRTEDGVLLEADFLPADTDSSGAVILFHQIPPTFDRTSYPQHVLQAFNDLGLNVLNVDRRGAGQSEGEAEDAYSGDGGRLDVEASVGFLLAPDRPCSVDPTHLVLVGASNGTTSVLDYVVGPDRLVLPAPVALIWLSPGSYTENQHSIEDFRPQLDLLPILWIHPESEDWSLSFYEGAPDVWRFVQLEDGFHGTGNFDGGALEDVQVGEMVNWIARYAAVEQTEE